MDLLIGLAAIEFVIILLLGWAWYHTDQLNDNTMHLNNDLMNSYKKAIIEIQNLKLIAKKERQ